MTRHRHVFLAWQQPETREILPVGRLLELSAGGFEFAYIRAAAEAQEKGFGPLVSFPDLERSYQSAELPALFKNRVMPAARPDYATYVAQLALSQDVGPIELLGRSEGRRATDKLEVFAPPHKDAQGNSETFALVRGVRHIPYAEEGIANLTPGERLLVVRDEQNPQAPHARLLRTASAQIVGFLPDYLARELSQHHAAEAVSPLVVTVERVNPPPAPVHHRVLCRIKLPQGLDLFRGTRYQPLSSDATQTAA